MCPGEGVHGEGDTLLCASTKLIPWITVNITYGCSANNDQHFPRFRQLESQLIVQLKDNKGHRAYLRLVFGLYSKQWYKRLKKIKDYLKLKRNLSNPILFPFFNFSDEIHR